ncbi:MAG TPA: alpha/beta hydrolase, partial [Ktedonobacteraceae bacterium]|nr:alpha/beta hydrolase [Ktedonobacteraceae bacterium]
MQHITSKDGTVIAFDRTGQGPALILVTGATVTRAFYAELAMTLAPHLTVFFYDRRGRGESGDTAPYAVLREVEDIEALINRAGGSAFVFGHSTGSALALEAARLLSLQVTKLAVYEPPFIIDDSLPPVPPDYVAHLTRLISSDRRGEAVEYYLKSVGTPAELIAQLRQSPMWPGVEALAHTVAYDG